MSVLRVRLIPVLLALASSGTLSWGQAANPTPSTSATLSSKKTNAATHPHNTKPSWTELTNAQQQALLPLATQWNTLHEGQKRKWLELSKNYPNLPPATQEKIHSRMNEWVALSPRQRDLARLNFAQTQELAKTLTPEQKQEKWQAYQTLSEQEKKQLAASKPKAKGAALATKPVSAKKLTHIPVPAAKPTPTLPPTLSPGPAPASDATMPSFPN